MMEISFYYDSVSAHDIATIFAQALESFTVSSHNPNGRQIACC